MLPQPSRNEILLRREIARLKARVDALEQQLGVGEDTVSILQQVLGLSRIPAQILGILMRRQRVVSKPVIFDILYGGRPECEQPADFKSIEVMMCQIRAAMRPHGMEIGRIVNAGYFMEAPTRAALAALMEAHREAVQGETVQAA